MNPWAPLLHGKCFAHVQYLSLHCSKIDKIMQQRLELPMSWKTHGETISSAYTASNPHIHVCEKEEEKNLGLPFFPFYLVLPLSLWCYQFPWGRFSAAAIGRPRLSKYMF